MAVPVAIAGFCLATNRLTVRPAYQEAYSQALKNLIAAYQWAMGAETGNHWEKLAVPEMQQLITTLGPWVTTSTLCTWRSDDLKPRLTLNPFGSNRRNELSVDFEAKLNQLQTGAHQTNWSFKIYGEESLLEMLKDAKVGQVVSQVCEVGVGMLRAKSA